jgi:hypothetical protein
VSTYSYTNARPTVQTDPTGEDPDNGGVFYGSVTAAEHRMNNPDAGAATTDAAVPDGGMVEVDIVACISTALQAVPWGKMFKAAKVAIKAVGVGRRLIDAYSNLKAARKALTSIPQRIKKMVDAPPTAVKSGAAKQVENTVKAAKDIGGKAKATAKNAVNKVRNKSKSATEESCKVAKGAGKRLSNSFVAGTLVVMADGTSKPIEKVQPGDTVRTTDAKTGISKPQQVIASITGSGDKSLVELTLVGAGGGGPSEVTATAGHKFYSPGKGWIVAGDLKPGDKLRDTGGRMVKVKATHEYAARTTVYNLTVDSTHTYYVAAGDNRVLVHNCMTTQAITERLQEHVDAVVNDFENGVIGLSPGQQGFVRRVGAQEGRERGSSIYEMVRGDVIDEAVKRRVAQDPKLNKILHICRRFEECPDFHDPVRNVWWDMTTDGGWRSHNKYTKLFGRGIHLPTR